MIVQSKERPARIVATGSKLLVAVCVEEKSKEVNGEVEQGLCNSNSLSMMRRIVKK